MTSSASLSTGETPIAIDPPHVGELARSVLRRTPYAFACSGSTGTIPGDHLWVALATQRHR
eukprot:4654989-Prymnesium_polylepis.2